MEIYYVLLDYRDKRIIFQRPREKEFTFQCPKDKSKKFLISTLRVDQLIMKGCAAFLASVVLDGNVGKSIQDVDVVKEFEDVFSEDLTCLPPDRELKFFIDLLSGTSPVSMAPYRMAPAELVKLKKQLTKLLEKGFVRPSVSPWRAPVLFVRKKDGSMRLCIDF